MGSRTSHPSPRSHGYNLEQSHFNVSRKDPFLVPKSRDVVEENDYNNSQAQGPQVCCEGIASM